jgi:hypothetical protein
MSILQPQLCEFNQKSLLPKVPGLLRPLGSAVGATTLVVKERPSYQAPYGATYLVSSKDYVAPTVLRFHRSTFYNYAAPTALRNKFPIKDLLV